MDDKREKTIRLGNPGSPLGFLDLSRARFGPWPDMPRDETLENESLYGDIEPGELDRLFSPRPPLPFRIESAVPPPNSPFPGERL